MIHVVIGIIINSQNQIFIAQRLAHQEKGGCWEFPGGKVEANESPFQALQRELQEELGIQVTHAEPWMQVEYHYPHKSVLLDTWKVTEYIGTPAGVEGQPVRWSALNELFGLDFPEGNRVIVERLAGV